MENTPKKYFFDNNDFDEEVLRAKQRAVEEAKRRPTFSQEEMEASRQTGFTQGRLEGQRETMAALEAQMVELMQQINAGLARFADNEDARAVQFVEQASLISSQILHKSLPALQDYLALPQLQAFLRDVLSKQIKKSNLTIYVPQKYEAPLNAQITALASQSPHGQSWVVQTAPDLSAYQCRIEWDGGGAAWNPEIVAQTALDVLLAQIPDSLKNPPETMPETLDETPQNPHNEPDNESDRAGD